MEEVSAPIVSLELTGSGEREPAASLFAHEICWSKGVTRLADELVVAPEPEAVATAYAQRYRDSSRRDATRAGCFEGLKGH